LRSIGFDPIVLHSAATDRAAYLRRPDLGRRLDSASRAYLERIRPDVARSDVALVVADGLSAVAIEENAVPLLVALRNRANQTGLTFGPTTVALQGRVALGDEIGELLGAAIVVVLIGERPGLSAADSMGVYMTWAPHVGRSDADRNCLSNIRAGGMSHDIAASKLTYLIREAKRLGMSGVGLKDETERDGATFALATAPVSTGRHE
jgi:ethanolamine ammonia-lyase small subunit